MPVSMSLSKGTKILTIVYSGTLGNLQTFAAGNFSVLDSVGGTAANSSSSTNGTATQSVNFPSTAGLTIGGGTVNYTNTSGVVDSLGRILDNLTAFPLTITA